MKVYFVFYNTGHISRCTIDEQEAIKYAQSYQGFVVAFDIPEHYNFVPRLPEPVGGAVDAAIADPSSLVSRERPLHKSDRD